MLVMYTLAGRARPNKHVRDRLEANGLEYIEKSLKFNDYQITHEEVKYLLQRCPYDVYDIIDVRCNEFLEIKEGFEDITTLKLIDMIVKCPRLLRSPIVISPHQLLIGAGREDVEDFIFIELRKRGMLPNEEEI